MDASDRDYCEQLLESVFQCSSVFRQQVVAAAAPAPTLGSLPESGRPSLRAASAQCTPAGDFPRGADEDDELYSIFSARESASVRAPVSPPRWISSDRELRAAASTASARSDDATRLATPGPPAFGADGELAALLNRRLPASHVALLCPDPSAARLVEAIVGTELARLAKLARARARRICRRRAEGVEDLASLLPSAASLREVNTDRPPRTSAAGPHVADGAALRSRILVSVPSGAVASWRQRLAAAAASARCGPGTCSSASPQPEVCVQVLSGDGPRAQRALALQLLEGGALSAQERTRLTAGAGKVGHRESGDLLLPAEAAIVVVVVCSWRALCSDDVPAAVRSESAASMRHVWAAPAGPTADAADSWVRRTPLAPIQPCGRHGGAQIDARVLDRHAGGVPLCSERPLRHAADADAFASLLHRAKWDHAVFIEADRLLTALTPAFKGRVRTRVCSQAQRARRARAIVAARTWLACAPRPDDELGVEAAAAVTSMAAALDVRLADHLPRRIARGLDSARTEPVMRQRAPGGKLEVVDLAARPPGPSVTRPAL